MHHFSSMNTFAMNHLIVLTLSCLENMLCLCLLQSLFAGNGKLGDCRILMMLQPWSFGGKNGILFPSSITESLDNCGCLWAHVCVQGRHTFLWECFSATHEHQLEQVWWKHTLAFISPGGYVGVEGMKKRTILVPWYSRITWMLEFCEGNKPHWEMSRLQRTIVCFNPFFSFFPFFIVQVSPVGKCLNFWQKFIFKTEAREYLECLDLELWRQVDFIDRKPKEIIASVKR